MKTTNPFKYSPIKRVILRGMINYLESTRVDLRRCHQDAAGQIYDIAVQDELDLLDKFLKELRETRKRPMP